MSQDIDVSASGEIAPPNPLLRQMLHEQNQLAISTTNDSDAFVDDLMESILSAETVDDIFAAQDSGKLISGKDFANLPFHVKADDISWHRSTISADDNPSAFPFYAILRVTTMDGEEATLNCGGKTFIATLWALYRRGHLTNGMDLIILSTPSPKGAFLSLKPVVRPKVTSGKSK